MNFKTFSQVNTPYRSPALSDNFPSLKEHKIPAAETAAARRQSILVLVAEDDAHIRRLSTAVLTDAGYHVDTAEDGGAAWDILQTKPYHLLITDHEMPKLSGIELIKKVRSIHAALPVILISGSLPEEELQAYSWLQINATLDKPCGIARLLQTVKAVLNTAFDPAPFGRKTT